MVVLEMMEYISVMIIKRLTLGVESEVSDSLRISYHARLLATCDGQIATNLGLIVMEAAEHQITPLPTTLIGRKR